MNMTEAGALLTYISGFDRRTVTQIEITAWSRGFPKWVTYDMAQRAVDLHFQQPVDPGKHTPQLTPNILVYHCQKVRAADRKRELAGDSKMNLTAAVDLYYSHHPELVPGQGQAYWEALDIARDIVNGKRHPDGSPMQPEAIIDIEHAKGYHSAAEEQREQAREAYRQGVDSTRF